MKLDTDKIDLNLLATQARTIGKLADGHTVTSTEIAELEGLWEMLHLILDDGQESIVPQTKLNESISKTFIPKNIANLSESALIRELANARRDKTALIGGIVEKARAKGIDLHRAEQAIITLKTKGIIYEPKHGKFMCTEG